MLTPEQLSALERRLARMERRQRRIEFGIIGLIGTAAIAMLANGDRTSFGFALTFAVVLLVLFAIRTVVEAGQAFEAGRGPGRTDELD